MGTVIQDMPQINSGSQPRWDRFERADLLDQYRELRTQGLSERQAAKELKVPRTTLQAWRRWHDRLDICPHVADFFQSGPGLAFLHRLVIAFHLVCAEIGACGIRLVCLFLRLTGLDRFVPPLLEESLQSLGVGVDISSTRKGGSNIGEIDRFDLKQTHDEEREAFNAREMPVGKVKFQDMAKWVV